MKDEIKEILELQNKIDEIKNDTYTMKYTEWKAILDYINNLQEENERLKETIENLTTMTVNGDRTQIKNTAQYKLDIAQDRIDKAIEYIKNNIADIEFIKKQYNCEIYDDYVETTINDIEKLLNILQGEGNETR